MSMRHLCRPPCFPSLLSGQSLCWVVRYTLGRHRRDGPPKPQDTGLSLPMSLAVPLKHRIRGPCIDSYKHWLHAGGRAIESVSDMEAAARELVDGGSCRCAPKSFQRGFLHSLDRTPSTAAASGHQTYRNPTASHGLCPCSSTSVPDWRPAHTPFRNVMAHAGQCC